MVEDMGENPSWADMFGAFSFSEMGVLCFLSVPEMGAKGGIKRTEEIKEGERG